MRRIIIGGAAAAVATALIVWAFRGSPVSVEIAEVKLRTVREFVEEDARTRLGDEYTLTMPVTGTIERMDLEVGDEVAEGQTVARVERFDLEQQVKGVKAMIDQARARIEGVDVAKPKPEDIESAEARVREAAASERMARERSAVAQLELADAETDYRRMQTLHDKGAVSQSDFDKAQRLFKQMQHNAERASLAVEVARIGHKIAQLNAKRVKDSVDDNEYMRKALKAQIDQLRTDLSMLEGDLAETSVKSPVTGPVLYKHVANRRQLTAGMPILTIGDMQSIEIECDVLSTEVIRIETGDPVEITGKALGGRTATGRVERIYPSGFKKISSLGIEQQRVKTIITFDNEALDLRPGTSLDVRIITDERKDVSAVPERATFRDEGQWAVFLVCDGRARLTPVEIGIKNDNWAEVVKGVKPGDRVVAEPKNEIKDGSRVTSY